MKRLEPANIVAACVALCLIVALYTPLADPARLTVGTQLARLADGKVSPEKFDYALLYNDTGKYGRKALERLKENGNEAIRKRAGDAMASMIGQPWKPHPLVREDMKANITVYPAGEAIPDEFWDQDWNDQADKTNLGQCSSQTKICKAYILHPDKTTTLIILDGFLGTQAVYAASETGAWHKIGYYNLPIYCPKTKAALEAGQANFTPHALPDLVIAGHHYAVGDTVNNYSDCQ